MAAEPRASELPEGTRSAHPRASVAPRYERDARPAPSEYPEHGRYRPRVAYRCGACGERFAVAAPGVAPCPRCQSVGDHDALGPIGGDDDER